MNNYTYQEVVFTHGQGCRLWDDKDRVYLDFMGGVGSVSLGHGAPAVLRALREQSAKLLMASGAFHTAPRTELAQRLIETAGLGPSSVCFANSGTEAVEGAMKLARKWAYETKGPHANGFLAFTKAYHGRSFGAASITEKALKHPFFGPYLPGVRFAPFNDLEATKALITSDLAAIIIEPLQGDGGLDAATPAFLRGLRDLADAHNIALIFDEVQCGMGRLGTLFAYETFGVAPDMVTISKALGGGVPIGALIAKEKFAVHFTPGVHGSTLAGNPLCCAVALAVLGEMAKPGFLKNVRERGVQLKAGLESLAQRYPTKIKAAKGQGLMQGLDVVGDNTALRSALMEAGLVTTSAGESVVRFLPPLIVSEAEVAEALTLLEGVLARDL